MRSRWYHSPELHSPTPGKEKKVGWLELFYDLIYVAAIIQLGNALSHHASLNGFLGFAALFVPLWVAWTSFTFYTNRFVIDDFAHRALVFLQMFGVGAMAISVPEVLEGKPTAFALSYAFVRLTMLILYVRTLRQVPLARELSKQWVMLFGIDAALWLASTLVPHPWTFIFWAVGIGAMLSIPLNRHSRDLAGRYPPDVPHMSERYGLLTIIVLGESFVKALSELSARGATSDTLLMGGMVLLITCSLWWIYFDDVAGSRFKKGRPAGPFIWVYMHLPLTLAVTAVGVATKKAIFFAPAEVAPEKYRWMICGTLCLVFFSVAIIDSVTERRVAELSDKQRTNARLVSAAVMLLLAPAGGFLSAGVFLALVTTVCVAQVIFDMMMAPMEDPEAHHHEDAQAVFDPDKVVRAPAPDPEAGRPRRDLSEAVRRGTPSELRRDLYFFFMEGSWARFLMTLVFVYLATNVVFACLYLLEPGSVTAIRDGSFLDAFSFSVQTLSTIGYGTMAPESDYAHMLVTVESGIGLLGVALATGLMFAKASRPTSSVLFSDKVVVTRRHGTPTLMFRVGNARGNEVVEAQIRVTVLKDEVSPEGHKFRTLHDVTLRRDTSPLFTLSFTVMHEIDETSPFHGLDWNNLDHDSVVIVCTMLGHDATYGQTTHARHLYYPEDIRYGERFVDVLSALDDGRMMVDYNHFHDTEVDPDFAPVD